MISIDGFLAVYFSIRKPTEDERQGARPPAVRMATFAYDLMGLRARGGWGGGDRGSRRGGAMAQIWRRLPAFRRMCVSCMRRPSHAFSGGQQRWNGQRAARAVPATRRRPRKPRISAVMHRRAIIPYKQS